MTFYSYLAYHLCFLKMSAIKITCEQGLVPDARLSLAKQYLQCPDLVRASAHLPLCAASELALPSQPAASKHPQLALPATQASCCNAQPWGKDFSLKIKDPLGEHPWG